MMGYIHKVLWFSIVLLLSGCHSHHSASTQGKTNPVVNHSAKDYQHAVAEINQGMAKK